MLYTGDLKHERGRTLYVVHLHFCHLGHFMLRNKLYVGISLLAFFFSFLSFFFFFLHTDDGIKWNLAFHDLEVCMPYGL